MSKANEETGSMSSVVGSLQFETGDNETRWKLSGDWALDHYLALKRQLEDVPHPDQLDFSGVTFLDTAGATLLVRAIGTAEIGTLLNRSNGLSPERSALLKTVIAASENEEPPSARRSSWLDSIARLGELSSRGWSNFLLLSGFLGLALTTLLSVVPSPRRWRLTSLVVQLHHSGLNAVPIVALLTFLVGAVVAFLGATVLSSFGATIYTVDLVAYSFMREFAVLLTAILLAGRSASSFTAQIGSMKINEEIDALRTMGLDPIEVLVLPRILALVIALPLLTFVALISGLAGGAVVSLLSLDISLTRYIAIVQEVPIRHFYTGMSKAPVFAFLIALIGCLEGLKVEGNARSLGEHTTSSVVQSIFVVILLDAVAALFFMEMDW